MLFNRVSISKDLGRGPICRSCKFAGSPGEFIEARQKQTKKVKFKCVVKGYIKDEIASKNSLIARLMSYLCCRKIAISRLGEKP